MSGEKKKRKHTMTTIREERKKKQKEKAPESDLALCMMLVACIMLAKLRRSQSMTVTGSLQGGVAMSQWRFNLQHAPNDEFTRLHRMPKEVFSKLVALCKSCYLKYQYCRVERRLRRRARRLKI